MTDMMITMGLEGGKVSVCVRAMGNNPTTSVGGGGSYEVEQEAGVLLSMLKLKISFNV